MGRSWLGRPGWGGGATVIFESPHHLFEIGDAFGQVEIEGLPETIERPHAWGSGVVEIPADFLDGRQFLLRFFDSAPGFADGGLPDGENSGVIFHPGGEELLLGLIELFFAFAQHLCPMGPAIVFDPEPGPVKFFLHFIDGPASPAEINDELSAESLHSFERGDVRVGRHGGEISVGSSILRCAELFSTGMERAFASVP